MLIFKFIYFLRKIYAHHDNIMVDNHRSNFQISFSIFFRLLSFIEAASRTNYVQQSTDFGKILGFNHETKSENHAKIFLGVPFALPPVSNLPFVVKEHFPMRYIR